MSNISIYYWRQCLWFSSCKLCNL